MSTIKRRQRISQHELSVYKRHELLTGKIFCPNADYDGYGDNQSTNLRDFITDEMRQDWLTHRDELSDFRASGQSTTEYFENTRPWLFLIGDDESLPWAAEQFDQK
jgi:hypothetical protein